MAKQQGVETPKAVEESTPKTKKYRFVVDKKEPYFCQVKDKKGNVVEAYLCVDEKRNWGDPMRERFEMLKEQCGSNVFKPGDVIELPIPAMEPYVNAAASMERAGAIKEVKD